MKAPQRMKTAELVSPLLDYWVATKERTEWIEILWHDQQEQWHWVYPNDVIEWVPFYSRDWSACGPLADRYIVGFGTNAAGKYAFTNNSAIGRDKTSLKIAICRAVIASVHGDEVPELS